MCRRLSAELGGLRRHLDVVIHYPPICDVSGQNLHSHGVRTELKALQGLSDVLLQSREWQFSIHGKRGRGPKPRFRTEVLVPLVGTLILSFISCVTDGFGAA